MEPFYIIFRFMRNFTLPKDPIYTYPASTGNEITKEYYNILVGEINRGTIQKALCKVEDKFFNNVRYYLISNRG